MIYSSDERVVGTWIDGKPLYEKTMQYDNVVLSPVDNTSGLKHLIENLDTGIVVEAYYKNSTVAQWTEADVIQLDSSTFKYCGWNVGATAFRVRMSGGDIGATADRKYLVKCRYTKTTDSVPE